MNTRNPSIIFTHEYKKFRHYFFTHEYKKSRHYFSVNTRNTGIILTQEHKKSRHYFYPWIQEIRILFSTRRRNFQEGVAMQIRHLSWIATSGNPGVIIPKSDSEVILSLEYERSLPIWFLSTKSKKQLRGCIAKAYPSIPLIWSELRSKMMTVLSKIKHLGLKNTAGKQIEPVAKESKKTAVEIKEWSARDNSTRERSKWQC